jgi:hypothetical protein
MSHSKGVRRHCEEFMKEFGVVPVVSCCGVGANKGGLDRSVDAISPFLLIKEHVAKRSWFIYFIIQIIEDGHFHTRCVVS